MLLRSVKSPDPISKICILVMLHSLHLQFLEFHKQTYTKIPPPLWNLSRPSSPSLILSQFSPRCLIYFSTPPRNDRNGADFKPDSNESNFIPILNNRILSKVRQLRDLVYAEENEINGLI
ncbi:Hypothetical predicted protein [Olea europaea subsp. europaea]|uniref:Uncharacterized protein n=1 Tax=Olea europaea subsp. europaea TaxID=158383 RepID=A0A8S0RTX6_OLEEU|nr:Hypothetical predicted protein [Olea europaea subsp. europaea]